MYTDLMGQQFGYFTVIAPAGMRGTAKLWKCRCACGSERLIVTRQLRYGSVISCGCSRLRVDPETRALNVVLKRYQHQARHRGLLWKLSKKDFLGLVKENCNYCDAPPTNLNEFTKGRQLASATYNGIDRLNNDIGYVAGNVVPCCFNCNRAKSSMYEDEFLAWICRIHNHCVSKIQ